MAIVHTCTQSNKARTQAGRKELPVQVLEQIEDEAILLPVLVVQLRGGLEEVVVVGSSAGSTLVHHGTKQPRCTS